MDKKVTFKFSQNCIWLYDTSRGGLVERLNRTDAFKYTSIEAVVKETILESRTKDLVENLSTLFLTLIDTYT